MTKTLRIITILCLVSVGTNIRGHTIQLRNDTSGPRLALGSSSLNPIGIVKTARRLLTSGVKMFRQNIQAAQKLKENVDAEVAQRESKVEQPSLSKMFREDLLQIPRDGMLGGIFRLMGVDSSSIGMVVLNVLIFFAEMITSNMLGKDAANAVPDTRMLRDNLMEWFIKGRNDKVDQVLTDARDSALPDSIISTLQQKTGNHTACIQLLICKMSPFIWGFQKTLTDQLNNSKNNGTEEYDARSLIGINVWDNLFKVFPDKNKFVSFGDNCEQRFPNCKLLKFTKKQIM